MEEREQVMIPVHRTHDDLVRDIHDTHNAHGYMAQTQRPTLRNDVGVVVRTPHPPILVLHYCISAH
jgi:hypothetical protein